MPQIGSFHGACRRIEGYGKALKNDIRQGYGTSVGFAGRGEMIPNEHTYCEIDPKAVDQWGIPVLRFHWRWSRARNQAGEAHARDLHRTSSKPWAASVTGLKNPERETGGISIGGTIIHEAGTVRMGDDPKTAC